MDNHGNQKSSSDQGWPPWLQAMSGMFSTPPCQFFPSISAQSSGTNSRPSSSSDKQPASLPPSSASSNSVASSSVQKKESKNRCEPMSQISALCESEVQGNETSISFWMWQAYQAFAKLQFSLWKVNELYQNAQAKTNSDDQPSVPATMGSMPFDMESLTSWFKNTQALSGTNNEKVSTNSTSKTQQENCKDRPGESLSEQDNVEPASSSAAAASKNQDVMESDGQASDDMEMSDEEAAAATSGTTTEKQNPYDLASSVPSIPSSNNLQHSHATTQEYSYANQSLDAVFNGSNNVTSVSSITPYSSESSWNPAVASQAIDSYLQSPLPASYSVQYLQHLQPTNSTHASHPSATVLPPPAPWSHTGQYPGSYPPQWGLPQTNQPPPPIPIPSINAYPSFDTAPPPQPIFVHPPPMPLHQNFPAIPPPVAAIHAPCPGLPTQTPPSLPSTFVSSSLPPPVMPTVQPAAVPAAQKEPATTQYSNSKEKAPALTSSTLSPLQPVVLKMPASQASSQTLTSSISLNKTPDLTNGSFSAQTSTTDALSSNRETQKSSGREVDRMYSYMRGRANDTTTSTPCRNLSDKFTASDKMRRQQRPSNSHASEAFSKPPKSVSWTHSEEFFRRDEKTGNMVGTAAMVALEDIFYEEILRRREVAMEGKPAWKPLDRRQFESHCCGHGGSSSSSSSSSSDSDDSDSSDNSNSSSDCSHSRRRSGSNSGSRSRSSSNSAPSGNESQTKEGKAKKDKKKAHKHRQGSCSSPSSLGNNNPSRNCSGHCEAKKNEASESSLDETFEKRKKGRRRGRNAEKKADADAKKLTNVGRGKKLDDSVVKGMRRMVLRTDRHRREVAHKMAHPHKLHPELWFNERHELNDGPACACKKRHQTGPLHNKFEGEGKVSSCDPSSNNLDRLYHYRMYVLPTVNFTSKTPTTIVHNGVSYCFDGYSIFAHNKLESLPSCQVMRYNILYTLIGREEKTCEDFSVRSLDLVTDFIFTELLELLDVEWRADGVGEEEGCRLFHLMPRFVRSLDSTGRQIEMLSMDLVISYLLDAAKPVFDDSDVDLLSGRADSKAWRQAINDVRGTLVTCPGKKPSAIRADQIDRRSLNDSSYAELGSQGVRYPFIIHISYTPIKLSLRRDPNYKKTMRNFLRMQYAMMNKVKVTQDDRKRLNELINSLEDFEHNRAQHRELTVECSTKGMLRTGIRPDVCQHALMVPSFLSHMRFHRALGSLEKRVNYNFKDKTLLHQALTHPSYRRTIFGTNEDHAQNSMLNCGSRYIDYGDRAKLFKEWRKRGLSHMIRVMSLMPSEMPVRSAIYGNERLEFLGDAVIEIISSVHLFYLFPNMTEGHLDAYRQALVQNHHLSKLAVRLGLHHHLLYTHGVDFCLDSTFTHARSDAFEAFMAAVYLDGGLNEVDRIFGSVLWCDDKDVLKVWCCPPPHVLQIQEPNGDRHWLEKGDLLKNLTKLEEQLGITYKHIRLLAKSLTLRRTGYNNYTYGDNQRLEFLGDSLLKYVTSDFLYRHFPHHHEGHLSLLKNSLVNKYTQSLVCSELGLDEYIIKATKTKYPTTEKYRADILEAFLGSLFVDKDLKWVERFCEVCFWPRLVGFILKQDWNDPKSKLQQCCLTLRDLQEEPEIAQYRILDYTGPTNQRTYRVGVYFKGKRLATGVGRSVQQAQMDAARRALESHHRHFPQLEFQKAVIDRKYGADAARKSDKSEERPEKARKKRSRADSTSPKGKSRRRSRWEDSSGSRSPPKRRRSRWNSSRSPERKISCGNPAPSSSPDVPQEGTTGTLADFLVQRRRDANAAANMSASKN